MTHSLPLTLLTLNTSTCYLHGDGHNRSTSQLSIASEWESECRKWVWVTRALCDVHIHGLRMEGCIPVEYLDMDIVTGRYKRYVRCLEQDFNKRYINRLIILGVLFCKHTKSNTWKRSTNDCLLQCESGESLEILIWTTSVP